MLYFDRHKLAFPFPPTFHPTFVRKRENFTFNKAQQAKNAAKFGPGAVPFYTPPLSRTDLGCAVPIQILPPPRGNYAETIGSIQDLETVQIIKVGLAEAAAAATATAACTL